MEKPVKKLTVVSSCLRLHVGLSPCKSVCDNCFKTIKEMYDKGKYNYTVTR